MLINKGYIEQLIAEGEHQQQDFKFEISNAKKIAKTLSAFSNTDGGKLLVGVKDNGKIAGVQSEEESYMIEAAAALYCKPQIEVEMNSFKLGHKNILIVDVLPSKVPIFALDEQNKWWAYIRIDDETILASPIHLKIWQQVIEKSGELTLFSKEQSIILSLFKEYPTLSLNQYCKRVKLPRFQAQNLLAQLVRYDIISISYQNQRFLFSLNPEVLEV